MAQNLKFPLLSMYRRRLERVSIGFCFFVLSSVMLAVLSYFPRLGDIVLINKMGGEYSSPVIQE